MTRDDVLRMADEAGITFVSQVGVASATAEWLERFAALVTAHEREECAKVCDLMFQEDQDSWKHYMRTADECAAAIRARGES